MVEMRIVKEEECWTCTCTWKDRPHVMWGHTAEEALGAMVTHLFRVQTCAGVKHPSVHLSLPFVAYEIRHDTL